MNSYRHVSRWLVCSTIALVSFHQGAVAETIKTVLVGNAGNQGVGTRNLGAVDYEYRIGIHEVTNAQYTEFLNSVDPLGTNSKQLFDFSMQSDPDGGIRRDTSASAGSKYSIKTGFAQKPVVFVSWYDALRFSNWMHNGQGAGDTESGAYTLLGGTATPSNAGSIVRNPDFKWGLASENEWYKAAFHKNDGVTGNYFRYSNGSDLPTDSDQPGDNDAPDPTRVGNVFRNDGIANGFNDGFVVSGSPTDPNFTGGTGILDVGSYESTKSPYGLLDTSGGVVEWNDTIIGVQNGLPLAGFRGDSYLSGSYGGDFDDRFSQNQFLVSGVDGNYADHELGFRVVQSALAVPEPSSVFLLAACALLVGGGRLIHRTRFTTVRSAS